MRIVVPVRSFDGGYRRLAGSLTAPERAELARRLTNHVISVASPYGSVIVVTPDETVATVAGELGAGVIEEPTARGLDSACDEGIRGAEQWMVIHSDLPCLRPSDVDRAVGSLRKGRPVIAPSHDGGTSLIGGFGSFQFAYGPGSFRRHLAKLPGAAVMIARGTLLDVDTAADVERLLA